MMLLRMDEVPVVDVELLHAQVSNLVTSIHSSLGWIGYGPAQLNSKVPFLDVGSPRTTVDVVHARTAHRVYSSRAPRWLVYWIDIS